MMRRNNQRRKAATACILTAVLGCAILSGGCGSSRDLTDPYPVFTDAQAAGGGDMSSHIISPAFFAEDLCVGGEENTAGDGYAPSAGAAAVFLSGQMQIAYAKNIYDRVYPASTTKILTAYLALKYGNPGDTIVVSSRAAAVPAGSSVAGFRTGDRITLSDALYGLILCSGNDAANVIAEYISGSNSEFSVLMNREARLLGATHSHFVNPHGYPEDDHYTTVYDLYLIFQAALENDAFVSLLSEHAHDVSYENAAGETVTQKWESTNQYFTGEAELPANATVLGGKTGSSSSSGYCLVLSSTDQENRPVISIVMKSETKETLYLQMSRLLENYG